ncbi:MAG: hypothetical protein JSV86_06730 [Gemmatimonadota bacterium]|nr:MAG: hypothetical protein JSV86_06730 [Gemmatimonadota bacterium]
MKRLLTIAILLATASPVLAQERTLIRGGFESGGFGAPVVKFSQIDGEFALFVGGRGGWIINHTFVLGGGGYGLVNDIDTNDDGVQDIELGYGGLELEYVNSSDKLIHFTAYLLIGGGGLSGPAVNEEAVFVLEPALNGELNVTDYFRFQAGAGFRWVSGVDSPGVEGSDLSSFYAQVALKFGTF